MRQLLYIALIVLLAACADDRKEPVLADTGETTVSIGIRTYADNEALNPAESRITSVRVYAFDGNRLDRMVYAEPNTEGSATVTMKVKPSAEKIFYVVVNENDGSKDAFIHADMPNGVEQVRYNVHDYFSGNAANFPATENSYGLPMFGRDTLDVSGNYPEGSPKSITIPVARSVARVDVYLKKAGNNQQDMSIDQTAALLVEQSAEEGYYAPFSVNGTKGAAQTFNTNGSVEIGSDFGVRPVFSFYVPEQTCATSGTRLKLTLSGVKRAGLTINYEPVLLGETGLAEANRLTKIERNKVHQLFCTLSPDNFDVNVVVLPWNVEEEDHGALQALQYLDSSMPEVILQSGKYSGGNLVFSNPDGFPIQVQAFVGENTTTPLTGTLTALSANETHTIAEFPANTSGANRTVSFWYKLFGKWYDTGVRAMQRSEQRIRILSYGNTPLGEGSVNHVRGVFYLLNNANNFNESATAPVKCNFAYLASGTAGIVQAARDQHADIICSMGTIYSATDIEAILAWLGEDPHRLFITAALDRPNYPQEAETMMQALQLEGCSAGNFTINNVLSGEDHPVYRVITNGKFGDFSGAGTFTRADNFFGWVPIANARAAGYVPILKMASGDARSTYLIHPGKRIIVMGEAWYYGTTTVAECLYNNGSTALHAKGEYPKLVANTWAWIVDKVILGRK